jgi:hypothetical protein
MNNHLSSHQIIEHKNNHDIWHWKSRIWIWDRHENVAGVKPVDEIPTLSLSLDN